MGKTILNLLKKNWQDLLVVFLSILFLKFPNFSANSSFFGTYFVSVSIWLIFVKPKISIKPYSLHKAYFYLLFSLTIAGSLFARIVERQFGNHASLFFIPVFLASLLVSKDLAIDLATFFSISHALLHGFETFPATFLSSVVVAITSAGIKKRLELAKTAMYVVLISLVYLLIAYYTRNFYFNLKEFLIALVFPVVYSIVGIGLLPYIEYISMIYSNLGMMELGNLNNPLLKSLSLRAPGTYYHSTIVANLAEAAAERIGANAILARTAGYFHDIGKIKRPYFYTENISEVNPHDELSPKLSHLIIQDHVKSGLELARKHRLPLLVQDVIPQHHGTRVQKFFYHKARAMGEEISENEFRYPGPKPQFKEAGIIMLADAVEAAARSIKNPTPGRIQTLVEEIVSGIYNERELDESGLTLEDLEAIAEEFTRILVNMFKSRVEYPKEEIKKVISLANGSSDKQNAQKAPDEKNKESNSKSS
ncbi:HDIG domain-containing metalloprotein [Pseudothermotoga thermarum]|uniref:7TM receptor with intracellular metal dependent phosphohydrolase n=1 Tax=Pseudothermotoga thermarum DSM 5069 TaxID=688269 RepID=F7YTT0_9THEM|nr:HDIG domain-containing metalloprotein [Pseudothermotoga thermarum]AEH51375.1 7TM receptor with intracellular metal dependent phosphohydrolase [Pseudothermotoga thermarum DSM 5069]